ncbi:hypothetical protein BDZ91DRAFT_720488 [Kalaharituber pfeilii]|nr:hypothetical protein BDZ91DRAFT_720488 [Kalaharituber pfeilii]
MFSFFLFSFYPIFFFPFLNLFLSFTLLFQVMSFIFYCLAPSKLGSQSYVKVSSLCNGLES